LVSTSHQFKHNFLADSRRKLYFRLAKSSGNAVGWQTGGQAHVSQIDLCCCSAGERASLLAGIACTLHRPQEGRLFGCLVNFVGPLLHADDIRPDNERYCS
jgi:hypothetical protein